MFRQLYDMLNKEHHFNKGLEVEVLKGYFQYLPFYKVSKIGLRAMRLSGYKYFKTNNNG